MYGNNTYTTYRQNSSQKLREERGHRRTGTPTTLTALVHHVVITANIPLAEFIDHLTGLTDQLLIEYVSRADDKVQTLLRNKEDKYWDYHRDYLEQQLERHFKIRQRIELREGQRQLYWCQKRAL